MRAILCFPAVAGILLLVGVAPARADDAPDLRWRFQKGQVLKYLFKHREVRTTEIGDQKLTTTTESEYDLEWTVREVDERGTATIDQKLTALRVSSMGKDFEFQYDSSRGNRSEDDYKKKLIQFFDQVRFAGYEVHLPAMGRPVRVQGFDKLMTEIAPEQAVVDFYGLNLRDATFSWFLQQVLGQLPGAAVKPGHKWEVSTEAKLPDFGQLTGKARYVLSGPVTVGDRPCQEIHIQGQQTLDVDMRWLNNPLRGPLKSTKQEGKVRVDPSAGRVQASEVSIHLEGTFKFGADDNPAAMKVLYEHALELAAKP